MAGEIARSEKLLSYEALERTALAAAEDAQKAIGDIAFWENAIVVSKTLQIMADWTLKIVGEKIDKTGFVKHAITPAYDGAKNVVAILNGSFTAQKLLKETSKAIIKGVAEYAKETGHKSFARALKDAGTLAKAAQDIHELHSIYTRKVDDGGVRGARATALKQLARVRAQIAVLKAAVQRCERDDASINVMSSGLP